MCVQMCNFRCTCANIWVFQSKHTCIPTADTCVFQGQTQRFGRADKCVCANAYKKNLHVEKPYSTSWHRHVDINPLRDGTFARAQRTRIRGICAHTCLRGYVDTCVCVCVRVCKCAISHASVPRRWGNTHARACPKCRHACVSRADTCLCLKRSTCVSKGREICVCKCIQEEPSC